MVCPYFVQEGYCLFKETYEEKLYVSMNERITDLWTTGREYYFFYLFCVNSLLLIKCVKLSVLFHLFYAKAPDPSSTFAVAIVFQICILLNIFE